MNEFDLPPGKYKLSTAFDPETGRRLAVYVFRTEPGYEKLLYRDYHPTTAALLGEDRFEVQPTGGKALGAEREEWWRKTSRRFEAETGAVISHKRFWYDDRPNVDERWKAID